MTIETARPSPRGIVDNSSAMNLRGLLGLLDNVPGFQHLLDEARSHRRTEPLGVADAAKPYLLAALRHHTSKPMVVVVPRPEDARTLYDQLSGYLGEDGGIYLFPEPDVLPFERILSEASTTNHRLLILDALCEARTAAGNSPEGQHITPLVVASASAAIFKTVDPLTFERSRHSLKVGSKLRVSEMLGWWVSLGYQREDSVEVPGTFSSRGGILDIFSPNSQLPARVELWGDQIESIRLFDPDTQRSVSLADQIEIIPAQEILPCLADHSSMDKRINDFDMSRCQADVQQRFQNELESLISGTISEDLPLYNGLINSNGLINHMPEGSLLIMDRHEDIEAEVAELSQRADELRTDRESRGDLPLNFPSPQELWPEFRSTADSLPSLSIDSWPKDGGAFGFRPADSYYGRPDRFIQDLPGMLKEGRRVVVVSRYSRRVVDLLSEASIPTSVISELDRVPSPGEIRVVSGSLSSGWMLPLEGAALTLLTDSELFGISKQRRSGPRKPIKREAFLSELTPGSYVVHIDHGVAQFTGTMQMNPEGEPKEYLVLEYAESDKLYVPSDQLDRVSPYVATSDRLPALTRLGTAEWSRTKERVKHSAQEMAKELLDLYAARRVAQGYAFPPDSPWQQELEDSFPYEETIDQKRTILEMKYEMEQPHPMDRLVCGDVGYGKTEVALRAAFKAVSDGCQVALLVPTTVLAQQHYVTFSQRLSPFPVRVEVLSRFRTKKEQQQVVEGIRSGTVDITIGTHRLLQKDVSFKNLGLVIVDEEQRFGVAHKERLKKMRREVDMLTLSATPIPRTLHMGLAGIRDMSTIDTAPEDRQPVKTYVSQHKDDVIKEAILRELDRGGQVFYLHNRINTIRRTAAELQALAPKARIAIGHGRMHEDDLEDVMATFERGEIDVLVCTTIIESGLDIPNANTLILDRADRFGLAQLYQLRGRVGRGSNRAYAYLLVPQGRSVTEAATKRLKAILEATELGSGYRIAMRDLEIRGAGNILGAQQSGHIHAVGFDLYNQLLNEAVAELKAGESTDEDNPLGQPPNQIRIGVPLAAHIPEDYINHLPTRLAIYQRLTKLKGQQEVDDIRDEMLDRFGLFPSSVEELLYLVGIKILATESAVESITLNGRIITLGLAEPVSGARLALEKALGPTVKVGNQQIRIQLGRGEASWKEPLTDTLENLRDFGRRLAMTLAAN